MSEVVDLRGIEPRPHPCHGCVLPMNYRPSLSTQTVYINSNFFQIKIRKGGGAAPLTISSFSLAANSLITHCMNMTSITCYDLLCCCLSFRQLLRDACILLSIPHVFRAQYLFLVLICSVLQR